jgi:hypothetical protein
MKSPEDKKVTTDDLRAPRNPAAGTEALAKAGKAAAEEQSGNGADRPELSPLFSDDVERDFRAKWQNIQTGFVDEPRHAVEQADELVATLMQQLAQSFSDQRSGLEKQWEQTDKVSTEDLRLALQRYRSFFERLLAI